MSNRPRLRLSCRVISIIISSLLCKFLLLPFPLISSPKSPIPSDKNPIFTFPGRKIPNRNKTHKMSGGVGPTCNDISLPKEEEDLLRSDPNSLKPAVTRSPKGGFFNFRQLNALAVMVIMSASGMVSLAELGFVIFSLVYMYFLSKFAFPQNNPGSETLIFDPKNKSLRLYVTIGAIIGLYAPIAYIFAGIFAGDHEGIKAAVPHVFLLASQVFTEGVAFSDRFSVPIRVFVPVFYNSRRMFAIGDWLRSELWKAEEGSGKRLLAGRTLAAANMAFWSFNLFGFLLPFYLPKAFKKYYVGSKAMD